MLAALLLAAALSAADLTAKAHQLDDMCAAQHYQDVQLNTRMIAAKRAAAIALAAEVKTQGWPKAPQARHDAVWLALALPGSQADVVLGLASAAKSAAASDPSLKPDVANLVDKACQLTGVPQLYGNRTIDEPGGWKYYQIEDAEHVNERRASMGLPAINVEGHGMSERGLVRLAGLRQQLLAMAQRDQDARMAYTEAQRSGGKGDGAAIGRVDEANLPQLKAVIAMHGWPGSDLVGEDGANAFWLLVQHADRDPAFQQQCLPLMEAAVKAGHARGSDLALLTDRVLVNTGKPQRYGTQFRPRDGVGHPLPIEDPAHVDERRKAVGLPPMAEYARVMEATYGGKFSPLP